MKMIYTNENRLLTGNVKNILESHGIEIILKNEFAAGAIGGVPAFEAWVEVWVLNDADNARALKIVDKLFSSENKSKWFCSNCNEENDASFEICWSCQNENL